MNEYALSGAAYPLKINGKEFSAHSLSDLDYSELDAFIQSKVIDLARDNLVGYTAEERGELLQAAIKAAASVGWGTPEGVRIMRTTEGALRLGWQMIKRESRITFSEFSKLAHGDSHGDLVSSLLEVDKVFVVLNVDLGKKKEDDEEDADREDASVDTKSG